MNDDLYKLVYRIRKSESMKDCLLLCLCCFHGVCFLACRDLCFLICGLSRHSGPCSLEVKAGYHQSLAGGESCHSLATSASETRAQPAKLHVCPSASTAPPSPSLRHRSLARSLTHASPSPPRWCLAVSLPRRVCKSPGFPGTGTQ